MFNLLITLHHHSYICTNNQYIKRHFFPQSSLTSTVPICSSVVACPGWWHIEQRLRIQNQFRLDFCESNGWVLSHQINHQSTDMRRCHRCTRAISISSTRSRGIDQISSTKRVDANTIIGEPCGWLSVGTE